MRCLNCGYNNEPNAQVCIKCGKPFNMGGAQPAAMPIQQQSRPTVLNVNAQSQEPIPRPTQLDTASMRERMGNIATAHTEVQNCPACGFPVARDKSNCPSCGYPLSKGQQTPQQPMAQPIQSAQPVQPVQPVQSVQSVQPVQPAREKPNSVSASPSFAEDFDMNMTVVCEKCGAEISIANKFCPQCGERVHLSTMPIPRKKSAPLPQCSLSIVPEENENIRSFKQDYAGNSIVLNRDNTEPTNRTITSRQQAILTHEDGKWFIENKSDYGTTYIVANRKIELQTGDVVILGDRSFVFDAEPKNDNCR